MKLCQLILKAHFQVRIFIFRSFFDLFPYLFLIFEVTQAAARLLVENLNANPLNDTIKSYASIINLSSVVAKNGNIGQANYSASKAGVEGNQFTFSIFEVKVIKSNFKVLHEQLLKNWVDIKLDVMPSYQV